MEGSNAQCRFVLKDVIVGVENDKFTGLDIGELTVETSYPSELVAGVLDMMKRAMDQMAEQFKTQTTPLCPPNKSNNN